MTTRAFPRLLLCCCLAVLLWSCSKSEPEKPDPVIAGDPIENVDPRQYLDKLELPPGFRIAIFAENISGPRSLALGENGTVFVGTFTRPGEKPAGKVYAITDRNNDFQADDVTTIAEGLKMPNGVALLDGDLYVAEIHRILRFDDIEDHLDDPPEPVIVNDTYPTDEWHGWKFIRFGPDRKLYVPVGAPCNTCEPENELYAGITRISPDGSDREVFATGIRNTVGFDWHPVTGELWFTDNGRDEMGEDIPPEELNHAPVPGLHFGFPYRYGKSLVDPTFATEMRAEEFQPAAIEMPAHTAPLGMRFYTGSSFPERYRHQVFLAEHGSWNRSQPDGYRISLVTLDGNVASKYEHFVTGWLQDGRYWGRPVDLEIMPDGSLLVSDDWANCIYRISYGPAT